MRGCWVGAMAAVVFGVASANAPRALGAVDLELRANPQILPTGRNLDVALYAVSADDTQFSALDVVLTWDPLVLRLHEVARTGPHNWNFMFGFMPDSLLDGLNDSLLDGDALFQAASFTRATATADGLLVGTLHFSTLMDDPEVEIGIVRNLGQFSHTKVYAPGAVDVTGTLNGTSVTVASQSSLSVPDLIVPAGRTGEIVVSGEIAGQSTYGVTIVVALAPRAGAVGTVTFTPAPPVDVRQLGDPWPGAGSFTPLDTDYEEGSLLLNGSVKDSGVFIPAPVTFAGPLSGFPVVANADARGVWDVKLTAPADAFSSWEGLNTALVHGTLTVVRPGDGDGSGTTDIRDFAEFQACFTGTVGPVDPSAYPEEPALRCSVYDFDADGDVDAADYAALRGEMSGPGR